MFIVTHLGLLQYNVLNTYVIVLLNLPKNTKVVIVLLNSPQFNAATKGLQSLRQLPIDATIFTKPSPLGKRHIIDKVPWPINY